MDFLRTLMLYMSLTFASTLQAAPTPAVTPTPAPTPTAVVETVAPQETPVAEEVTPTPDVQLTPAPPTPVPEPTITPNRGYRNVKQGDRGDQVKQLQQRLIELGYLEEGSADGAFGNMTRRALIAFQEANGLVADGVAGDATQTHLYENPDVKENPHRPTPTPPVTPTPPAEEPSAPDADESQADAAPTQESVSRQWLWQASIAYNESTEPLTFLSQEDGVTITSKPRVYQLSDGSIQLSLSDLAASISTWEMRTEGDTITLLADGYQVVLSAGKKAYTCTVEGKDVTIGADDAFLLEGDPCISASFLEKALGATVIWDKEESTLIIRLLSRELAQATD